VTASDVLDRVLENPLAAGAVAFLTRWWIVVLIVVLIVALIPRRSRRDH
jgi:hypothetical protein